MVNQLPKVSLEDRSPRQVPTPLGIRKRCDFWECNGWKCSMRIECHSYAEYLAAGLLELDSNVRNYIPQPFRFRVGSTWYTPDFWLQDHSGREIIWELKPNAEFNESWRKALILYCQDHFIDFQVVANEAFVGQEIRALNSWYLVRWRNLYKEWPRKLLTSAEYLSLLGEDSSIRDCLWDADQRNDMPVLLAYLDGILSGSLRCDLSKPLSWDTKVGLA